MKRNTIAALIMTVVLIAATLAAMVETGFFGTEGPRYAFVSESQAAKITNISYNYTEIGKVIQGGNVIEEYQVFYPYKPANTVFSLFIQINKWDNASQALQEYEGSTYIQGLYSNGSYSVINASFLGFTYSYFHSAGGYPSSTFFYGVNGNFDLTIQLDFRISNNSLTQLIQTQIQTME